MALRTVALSMAIVLSTTVESLGAVPYIETGNNLLEVCVAGVANKSSEAFFAFGACIGYISAIRQASRCGSGVNGFNSSVPLAVQAGQSSQIVVKWLNAHPEKLHLGAAGLVAAALEDTFPCP